MHNQDQRFTSIPVLDELTPGASRFQARRRVRYSVTALRRHKVTSLYSFQIPPIIELTTQFDLCDSQCPRG